MAHVSWNLVYLNHRNEARQNLKSSHCVASFHNVFVRPPQALHIDTRLYANVLPNRKLFTTTATWSALIALFVHKFATTKTSAAYWCHTTGEYCRGSIQPLRWGWVIAELLSLADSKIHSTTTEQKHISSHFNDWFEALWIMENNNPHAKQDCCIEIFEI